MPKYAETIRVRVHQVKSAVDALDHKYHTGQWPNNKWNDGKIIRLANELEIPMLHFTSKWGVMTAMKLWLAWQERKAYRALGDNRPPWE